MRTISAMQVEEDVDCKTMAVLEFKKREMEQQVEILRWKRTCQWARRDIGCGQCVMHGITRTRQTNELRLCYDGSNARRHVLVFGFLSL